MLVKFREKMLIRSQEEYSRFIINLNSPNFLLNIIRVLAIFSILIEIFLSIQRYMILKNKPYLKEKTHKRLLLGLLMASFIYYTPLLVFKQIVPFKYNNQTTNSTTVSRQEYNLEYNELGLSRIGMVIPIVLQMIRFFLGSIVNSAINLVVTFEFRKRYATKKKQNDTIEICK